MNIPIEIHDIIFEYLNHVELNTCYAVCKEVRLCDVYVNPAIAIEHVLCVCLCGDSTPIYMCVYFNCILASIYDLILLLVVLFEAVNMLLSVQCNHTEAMGNCCV